jgi:predicted phosphodiesterase
MTPNDLKKIESENIDDYLLRLGNNKELYSLNWQQVADKMNEESKEDFGESKWRKDYFLINRGFDLAIKNNVSENEVLQEIKDKTLEFQKERVKVQDQRRVYANLVRVDARFEKIHEDILVAIKELEKNKPLNWSSKDFSNDSDREAALILSDWHKGLFARNYWNNFDNDVFNKRVIRVTEKAIKYGKENNVKVLHVLSLGDLVNGLIHVTTRILSVEDVITQTKLVAETLSEVLCKLSNEFEQIKFYQCRGNHDRVTPNKSDEISKESFADIVPWFIQARLSHINNIEFIENAYDDEIIVADILGNKIIATHGHKDKVCNVVQNLSQMLKIFPDYILMGHVHHHEENEFHNAEIIVNSSLSGVDSYAKDIRRTSKPAQKFIVFDKVETRLNTYNIRLDIV